ncbi:Uncharacterized protein Adt_41181 [Abeliophyllum distichum]|uniref:Transposase n=1 Tax=Abeliophyllum distichum TaxID=126358 RepID=A0ABD1PN47_9LAMI
MGFNNKRATFMAKKYASSFKSDLDLRQRAFRNVVKQDCNVDISKWTFYRTRNKCMEQIRCSIQDQYMLLYNMLLYNYCEQLKVINVDGTVVLDDHKTGFRRLCIYLAA